MHQLTYPLRDSSNLPVWTPPAFCFPLRPFSKEADLRPKRAGRRESTQLHTQAHTQGTHSTHARKRAHGLALPQKSPGNPAVLRGRPVAEESFMKEPRLQLSTAIPYEPGRHLSFSFPFIKTRVRVCMSFPRSVPFLKLWLLKLPSTHSLLSAHGMQPVSRQDLWGPERHSLFKAT